MKIWIDTASGTWGEVDGDAGRLLIVDAEDGAEAAMLINTLENLSDSGVATYGDQHGHLAS